MDAKKVAPFVDAFFEIVLQLGLENVRRGSLSLKEGLIGLNNVTALIGLSKDLRGSIGYSMSEETGKQIASIMMMGMPIDAFDEIAQSAIGELANMVTGSATMNLEQQGIVMEISPPTLIVGENVVARIGQSKTLVVEALTDVGLVEINIGLEL